mmetsp:Transcript_3758/g.7168  ORF Transcript_3758/g.7168 Transcript_3758/m.7168 type:complete len:201 (+) Transcript_3758:23-625(+)
MGGVVSAGAVAFGGEPQTHESISFSMLRGCVVGGVTMITIHILSIWSCSDWALFLQKNGDLEEAELTGAVKCLKEFCYYENFLWAGVACLTVVLGAVASMFRNKWVGKACMAVFIIRGLHCIGALMYAIWDTSSCQFWSLTKAYWLPLCTLTNAVIFAGLSHRFSIVVAAEDMRHAGKEMEDLDALDDLLSDLDWDTRSQ